jgi:hypothetical protein
MWSRKHDKCIVCGTTERRHKSLGLCVKCYKHKQYKLNFERDREKNRVRANLWYYANLEKAKESRKNWRIENKEKDSAWHKEWKIKNIEKVKKNNRDWYLENIDLTKERSKKWKEENADNAKKSARDCSCYRYHSDVHFRIKVIVGSSIRCRLKNRFFSKNRKKTWDFLPYTVDELKQHLENLFESWMNWNNWGISKGKWNIDHIKPDSLFNYKSMEDKEFQDCWALSNLRPLDAIENIKKWNKY